MKKPTSATATPPTANVPAGATCPACDKLLNSCAAFRCRPTDRTSPTFPGSPTSTDGQPVQPHPIAAMPKYSLRKFRCIHPGNDAQRVLVVKFLQDLVRQRQPVHLPEGVPLAVVVKILIIRFEHPEIIVVFGALVGVLAKQHAVLILGEEFVGCARLPAQIVEHRADLR